MSNFGSTNRTPLRKSGAAHQRNPARLGWAAGMVDGDGCITAVLQRHQGRKHPSVRLRLMVVQNDFMTLDHLRHVVGGRCHLNQLKAQSFHNRTVYQLYWDGRHAMEAIRSLRPHLVRKAHQANAALKLYRQGQLGIHPGPAGLSAEVLERRSYWVKRLSRMK